MKDTYYEEALKAGQKEYRASLARGQFPYLPVLDEILKSADIRTEQKVGLIKVPLEYVVGTSTMGRTMSFADNFMPIMKEKTEFASKWENLAKAQVEEGIRDPIKAYEFMHRYYAVEGNKRVSVLKYFGANEIMAEVTRKVPRESDEPYMKIYYELMHFMDVTDIYTLEFTKPGLAGKILESSGNTKLWDDMLREQFNTIQFNFSRAYKFRGGEKLNITIGDALAVFMDLYGWETLVKMTPKEYDSNIVKVWNEFKVIGEHHAVDLKLEETEEKKPASGLISLLLSPARKKLSVVFLYPKSPEDSDWIYSHELGRTYLQETFPEEIETIPVIGVTDKNVDSILEDVILQGADIIFAVAPQFMKQCLKAAIAHPEVKILNCSLNTPHGYIRTYYARMYEAKFISGMIAGSMTENDKVAYIADYPLYGMIANINAFARGLSTTNPRAKVYLAWSTQKGFDKDKFLTDHDIHIVSDQDMITPKDESRRFGLYHYDEGRVTSLVMPVWNWGVFYEKLIRNIMNGTYQDEKENAALNYWWGMQSGVVDIICSKLVPVGVRTLADHMHEDFMQRDAEAFYGEIRDQAGTIRNQAHRRMKPRDIMKMDYLLDNVIGTIPEVNDYIDDAKSVIEEKGVEETKTK